MRRVWFACGVGILTYGAWLLLAGDTNGTRPVASALWAIGALAVHDGLWAPAIFALGWLLRRVLPARVRACVLPVLALAGVVALLAIPRWRSPAPRQNASVWPPLSIVDIVLAAAAALAALGTAHGVAAYLSARARRSSDRPAATGR